MGRAERHIVTVLIVICLMVLAGVAGSALQPSRVDTVNRVAKCNELYSLAKSPADSMLIDTVIPDIDAVDAEPCVKFRLTFATE